MTAKRVLLAVSLLCMLRVSVAQNFPDPMTLKQAIDMASNAYPAYARAQAQQQEAEANLALTRSDTGLQLNLRGEALYIEPSELATDTSRNDSWIGLELRKKLYDFGVTRARVAAGEMTLEQQALQSRAVLDQYRLLIVQHYLDVLLADHAFRVADEAMAIAYVTLDKARDRHALGQVSDIDLMAIETEYQDTRSKRFAAQARQRTTRMLLAEVLGNNEDRPRILAEPDLAALERALPSLNDVMSNLAEANPELRMADVAISAAQQSIEAAQGGNRPSLYGKAGAYDYEKERSSRDEWIAGIELNVPLLTGGRVSAEKQRAIAQWQQAKAERDAVAMQMRQRAAQVWERIQVLQAERDAALTRMDYRELYLDRSRLLYEMEVATDLGDAMVESTRARLLQAQADYALLLAWAELDLLQGLDPWAMGEVQ